MRSAALAALAADLDALAAAAPPRAPVAPVALPEGLRGVALDIWILEQEVTATRTQLAAARAANSTRTAPLQSALYGLLDRLRELRPAPPPDPAEELARWSAERDAVVAKIEAGVAAAEAMAASRATPTRPTE